MRNVNISISSNLNDLQACVVINIENESSELWSKRTILASKRLSDKADFGDVKKMLQKLRLRGLLKTLANCIKLSE